MSKRLKIGRNLVKSVALHSLGCKVNSYETDVMSQELSEHGYSIVPFDEKADIYIINTCTVTNIADRKSRQMLHKAKKENPKALVVAVGCYVETGREGVIKDECIDIALGNKTKNHIAEILDEYFANTEKDSGSNNDYSIRAQKMFHSETKIIGDERNDGSFDTILDHHPGHTRAYIKIQDGCNQFCTYCIIPYARGRIISRDKNSILSEIRRLAINGCKEVVLTGIHISSYGLDNGEPALVGLVSAINEIDGIERIRLGSIEPRLMTRENVTALSSLDKLCPHFHLSLQSGCDETLKRMNRHYTCEEFRESVRLLREAFDNPAITTDVIVGFPGETPAEFESSRDFLEEIRFYEMHVFKYSIRHGTPAATMPMQLTDKQKSERSDVLLEMTDIHSKAFRELFIGKTVKVLWEDAEVIYGELYIVGHTTRYVRVAMKIDKDDESSFAGKISEIKPYDFLNNETLIAK